MLVYVEGDNFLGQTFVVQCGEKMSVGGLKALVLHMLYDVGLGGHCFRLAFQNQFLKEPLPLTHYNIKEMSVLQMVPISYGHHTQAKTPSTIPRLTTRPPHPHTTHTTLHATREENSFSRCTLEALRKELKIFKKREDTLKLLRVIIFLETFLSFVNFGTAYWWSALISAAAAIFSILLIPQFTYVGGHSGAMKSWDKWRVVLLSPTQLVLTLFHLGLFLYLLLLNLLQNACSSSTPTLTMFHDPTLALGCSHNVWLALVIYPLLTMFSLTAAFIAMGLRVNLRFQAGLLVEPTLSQTRTTSDLIKIAQEGSVRDKRQVAFELGNIALLGENKKEEIASAGGFQVLISLISEEDTVTQEYAIEALAEILSLQSIQSDFVSLGGVAIVSALLCSPNQFVLERAAVALFHLTGRCSGNRVAAVQERGVESLIKALLQAPPDTVPVLLQSLLHLAHCPNTLPELCNSLLVEALIGVLRAGQEEEAMGMVLQVLDEIGKLQPEITADKVSLISSLLECLTRSGQEPQVALPTLRLLMIFAKDNNKSRYLLENSLISSLEETLQCGTQWPGLVEQVVLLMKVLLQHKELVAPLLSQGVKKFLENLRENSNEDVRRTVISCLQKIG